MRRLPPLSLTVTSLVAALVLSGCSAADPTRDAAPPPERGALADAPVEPGTTITAEPTRPPQLQQALGERGPAVAVRPHEVAAQLRVADEVLADTDATEAEVAAAGHLQQAAYLELGPRPGWDARVLAAVPQDLRRDVRDNLASRRAFLRLHGGTSHRSLPAWRIVAPAPVADLKRFYDRAERVHGVPWSMLAAINLVETGMGRIRGLSYAGARGPMQFMPATWAQYGRGDIDDPRDAILSAGRYLAAMGYQRDPERALFRYNNSRDYVTGVQRVARVMERDPDALAGYHAWQVYYATARGSVRLPEGYAERRSVRLGDWLATDEGRSARPLRAVPVGGRP